jgi:hypothetical protein
VIGWCVPNHETHTETSTFFSVVQQLTPELFEGHPGAIDDVDENTRDSALSIAIRARRRRRERAIASRQVDPRELRDALAPRRTRARTRARAEDGRSRRETD